MLLLFQIWVQFGWFQRKSSLPVYARSVSWLARLCGSPAGRRAHHYGPYTNITAVRIFTGPPCIGMLTFSKANQKPRALGGSVYYQMDNELESQRAVECIIYQKWPLNYSQQQYGQKNARLSRVHVLRHCCLAIKDSIETLKHLYLPHRVAAAYKWPYFAKLKHHEYFAAINKIDIASPCGSSWYCKSRTSDLSLSLSSVTRRKTESSTCKPRVK